MSRKVEYRSKEGIISLKFPLVMGIVNVTPDSFFEKSRVTSVDKAWEIARQMWSSGAGIIDIGGASSRPGAVPPGIDEELDRVIPLIKRIASRDPEMVISIDTYRSEVAAAAIQAGAHIVNDISAGALDPAMIHTVASLHVPYIAMHMQGTPLTMQDNPTYENIALEVLDYFYQLIHELHEKGVYDIIIDPGFGFGKTIMHNYELLYKLHVLKSLDCPILAGISRKSMIYKLLGKTSDQALVGGAALHWELLSQGADILRVHDVEETLDVVRIFEQTKHLNAKMNP